MPDVPTSSNTLSTLLAKDDSQIPKKILNGSPQEPLSYIKKSLGVSGNNSREASVLTKEANQLSLGSPFESSSSSDDGPASEDHAHTEPLPYYTKKTGLCYDARMRFHTELSPPKDRSDYHPEDPRRILHIYRELCEAGLVADNNMAIPPITPNPVYRILARAAKKTEVCLVHDDAHFEFIKSTSSMSDEELSRREKTFDSIYFHRQTYSAALLSAGAAIETCLAVASGQVKNAIAVIRPPGHHAECDTSRGFCHFDNVSIAAQVVRQTYPEKYRKILIVDWDVHHGNGIQQAFESNPNVLYISLHVHENGNFYPSGPYGDLYHCGVGAGIGKNINIPWPTKGMGDADYLFAFQHVIMPVAFDFNPDLVIIAAGFDAAVGDQLGGCFVTPACYGHMTHMLMSLADGKLVVCLEGGYNLRSISKSALAVTKTLMGEPPERIAETAATRIGVETVHVIRAYQSKVLHDSHKMINIWIFREKVSRSFEYQVLATKNYSTAVPLLVIFHDPPEVTGVPNAITNQLDLHNTWLADVSKSYIEWAVNHGFGVMDVNVPKFLTGISDEEGDPDDEALKITEAVNELAIYLYDNYIECNESPRVFFLGIGDAFRAILHLLNTRNYEALEQIAGVIGFVAQNPIRPVTETFITDFAKWYYKRSLLFVNHAHPVWERDNKKISKKFGALRRSPADGVNAMLLAHKPDVEDFLAKRAGVKLERPREQDEDTIMVAGA
ncbi:Histone deacetylase hda1 [Xylographa trunciseda]|nr:Histone deacetylase hda1 [Xylographa trunciseda]